MCKAPRVLLSAALSLLLFAGITRPASCAPPLPDCSTGCGYEIVQTYPHDRGAFTQGLVYSEGVLLEGTGLNGSSSLRRVDLASGGVQQQINLPSEYFGEGITLFGDRIIQLTWKAGVGFVYDKDTFALIQQFSYPTEGWGITHDGKKLIMSDGTAMLYFLDPVSFLRLGSVEVRDISGPVRRLNELEYIGGEVFANVWQTNYIVRISPTTGQVLGWIDLSGLLTAADQNQRVDVLNGIAYDGLRDRIFVTGKLWPKLFEIRMIPPPPPAQAEKHTLSETK